MPTIFTDEDVQKYTRWQRFKMYAKIRAGMTWLHESSSAAAGGAAYGALADGSTRRDAAQPIAVGCGSPSICGRRLRVERRRVAVPELEVSAGVTADRGCLDSIVKPSSGGNCAFANSYPTPITYLHLASSAALPLSYRSS